MEDSRRLETKVDTIQDDITEIKVTLAVNTQSLIDHVRRTNLLEAKIEPLDTHVKMVNGALKLIGVLTLVIGLAEAILHVAGK